MMRLVYYAKRKEFMIYRSIFIFVYLYAQNKAI